MEPECLPVDVKQEPPEEFLLFLPPAMDQELETEQVEVKQEPPEDFICILPPATEEESKPEEFLLIIPPATDDEPEIVQDEVGKPKRQRQRSKKLAGSSSVLKCDQCSYQTDKKGNLTVHEGSHNKSKGCETCQKKFSTNRSLKHHQMQNKHGIYETTAEEIFVCDRCDRSYRTRYYLDQHQRNVHDENEVKCEVCGKICRNRRSLHNHSQAHVKVECSICRKVISKRSMFAHKLTHSTKKPFECDLCEYSAKTKRDLKEHIERMHLLRRLENDSNCQADFSDFKLLEELQHKYGIVIKSSEKKFKCEKCDKAFGNPTTLNHHKTGVHVEKTFGCETCKKAFKTRGNLKQHKTNVHAKVSCSICSKKVSQRYLKAHMKLLLPGHRFECDFCGFKTARKLHLKRHINARHRNEALERNFECREEFANVQQAPSSQPGDPHEILPESASNESFMHSFVDLPDFINNFRPSMQLPSRDDGFLL